MHTRLRNPFRFALAQESEILTNHECTVHLEAAVSCSSPDLSKGGNKAPSKQRVRSRKKKSQVILDHAVLNNTMNGHRGCVRFGQDYCLSRILSPLTFHHFSDPSSQFFLVKQCSTCSHTARRDSCGREAIHTTLHRGTEQRNESDQRPETREAKNRKPPVYSQHCNQQQLPADLLSSELFWFRS